MAVFSDALQKRREVVDAVQMLSIGSTSLGEMTPPSNSEDAHSSQSVPPVKLSGMLRLCRISPGFVVRVLKRPPLTTISPRDCTTDPHHDSQGWPSVAYLPCNISQLYDEIGPTILLRTSIPWTPRKAKSCSPPQQGPTKLSNRAAAFYVGLGLGDLPAESRGRSSVRGWAIRRRTTTIAGATHRHHSGLLLLSPDGIVHSGTIWIFWLFPKEGCWSVGR